MVCVVCGMCPHNRSPCVHSTRPRVYVQNVPVCTGTTRTHVSTCARGVGTHGDVLGGHTWGVFMSKIGDLSIYVEHLNWLGSSLIANLLLT